MAKARVDPGRCPECGERARWITQTLYALAELEGGPRNRYDYAGSSEPLWDTMETHRDEAGAVELQCVNGHLWRAAEGGVL